MSVPISQPTVTDPEHQDHVNAVKHTLDKLTGQHEGAAPLAPLPSTATLVDVIKALNVLIARVS